MRSGSLLALMSTLALGLATPALAQEEQQNKLSVAPATEALPATEKGPDDAIVVEEDKVVCRAQRADTGSRLRGRGRVCKLESQWEFEREEAERFVEDNRSDGPPMAIPSGPNI